MSVAAVPAYLGTGFTDTSPALRFGLLLPIWTTREDQETEVRQRAQARSREGEDVTAMLRQQGMDLTILALRRRDRNPLPGLWDKNDFAAREAWKRVTGLTQGDRDRMEVLAARQSALAAALPVGGVLHLPALATAPFTTGLGNEHPLENGFAFLNPYGLPYLPGSGVKGVLRQAARELASGEWGEPRGWDARYPHPESLSRREMDRDSPSPSGRGAGGEGFSVIDLLFGLESGDGDTTQLRGALSFWDVIPQIKGDSLQVEIMTPHQSHYYQQKAAAGSTSPHDSGSPNPISFLTVPPGSGFHFFVTCDLAHLQRLAPELANDGKWKALLTAAFEHAFQWLGFGAKTAVGYGALRRDYEREAAERRAQEAQAQQARQAAEAQRLAQEKEAALAAMDPVERSIQAFLESRQDKNQPEISAVIAAVKQGKWQGAEKRGVTQWLKTKMEATPGQWKPKSQAKRPERDKEHQNTLLVLSWLDG